MLNDALRILRVFNDIKAKDLAKQLGISPSYLSEIETGKKEPSLSIIKRYAGILKTTPSSILFFSEDVDSASGKKNFKNILAQKTIKFLQSIESEKD